MFKILKRLLSGHHHGVAPTLKAIYICASAGEPIQSVPSVLSLADSGLEGDRYSQASGFWKATDACQVTLISEDDLRQAKLHRSALLQDKLDQGKHRRNLLISGLNTKQLEGKTFRIGEAVFRYHKPRPPCGYLEKLEGEGISKALGRRSGICLQVIHSGALSIGDRLEIIDGSI